MGVIRRRTLIDSPKDVFGEKGLGVEASCLGVKSGSFSYALDEK
jgi:hypothetical protein